MNQKFRIQNLKNKGNKNRYKANNSIMEKIDEAISAIEKGKVERCQKKLAEGKKIILKQKLLRMADREEDGWEVVKCYLSDDLASDSEDEKELVGKQLQTKRKGKQIRKKIKRNSFGMRSPSLSLSLSLSLSQKKIQNLKTLKSLICLWTRRTFSIFLPKQKKLKQQLIRTGIGKFQAKRRKSEYAGG